MSNEECKTHGREGSDGRETRGDRDPRGEGLAREGRWERRGALDMSEMILTDQ